MIEGASVSIVRAGEPLLLDCEEDDGADGVRHDGKLRRIVWRR